MKNRELEILINSQDFFNETVEQAFRERKVETHPQVKSYLVGLLEFYLDARNLHEDAVDELGRKRPQTLAELYLVAQNSEPATKVELLKKLADRSLYISGFFGDSFSRKIIDVDYYVDMGGTAYGELSYHMREDTLAKVYSIFSKRFADFVDVLTCISQNSFVKSDESVLRLYDRYLKTGSVVAREKLAALGVMTVPLERRNVPRKISS